MNREFAKKHQDVINHWMNGGIVLRKAGDEWVELPKSTYGWNTDQVYIIDDNFAHLRIAEAEGEIIQFKANRDVDFIDLSDYGMTYLNQYIKEFPHLGPDRYRVKCKHHSFKVGDWVVVKGFTNGNRDGRDEIFKILCSSDIELINSFLKSQYWLSAELWVPTDYEYCWFWNRDLKDVCFGRYKSTLHNHQSWDLSYQFDYVEPFVNKIPSKLEDDPCRLRIKT